MILPNADTLYCMKLHAFRDEHIGRKGAGRAAFAVKHAADLYTITALLTQEELAGLDALRDAHQNSVVAKDAAGIVVQFFADPKAPGAVQVRQAHRPAAADLGAFLDLLRRTFPWLTVSDRSDRDGQPPGSRSACACSLHLRHA